MKQSSPIFPVLIFIIFCGSSTLVVSLESCSSNVDLSKIAFRFTLPDSVHCVPVWDAHNFILRDSSHVWDFVLSYDLDDKNSYVAIGFSGDGRMVGSTAVVWFPLDDTFQIGGYNLGGKSSADVAGNPNITISNGSYVTFPDQKRIYIAFQLETSQPSSNLLYAIGPKGFVPSGPNFALIKHIDRVSTKINYKKGTSVEIGATSLMLSRSHGILNMAGWSLLMIIGAIISRHCKQWDPIWFYVHMSIQTFAFLVGIIGILCGFALSKKLCAPVKDHKNIAILILILGFLQVLAIIIRPGKESKIRKYWNWYHHYVGRILICFAVVNTFYGLSLGGEGSMWLVGYGVTLAVLFIVAIILEIRLRRMKSRVPVIP